MISNNLRKMDLNLFKVFNAIYAERHVTRAATHLMTSQSAVSHSLRNLRHIFHDPLFTRTPDGMSPTALADLLAARISHILDEAQDVLAFRAGFDAASAIGRITIGLLSPAPPWLVAGIGRALHEQSPQLDIVFRTIEVEEVGQVLDDRLAHIVIGAADRVPDRNRFAHEGLYREALVCLVGVNNPLVGEQLDLESYAQLTHIAVATGTFGRSFIDDILQKAGLTRHVRMLVPSSLVVADLLATSDQICTLLPSLVLPDPRIRAIPTPFPAKSMTMGQFYHRRDEGNPQTSWLRGMVKEVCRDSLSLFAGAVQVVDGEGDA
jgi:DNA-binding transcriptional LysR family regulator